MRPPRILQEIFAQGLLLRNAPVRVIDMSNNTNQSFKIAASHEGGTSIALIIEDTDLDEFYTVSLSTLAPTMETTSVPSDRFDALVRFLGDSGYDLEAS